MIHVREARFDDISHLVRLEKMVWREGTTLLSEEDLLGWLEEKSPFFLVAESDSIVCGYYFGRQINFSWNDLDQFVEKTLVTNTSWSSTSKHTPGAKIMYGISTASSLKGAGAAMSARAEEIWKALELDWTIGYSRINGFDEYYRSAVTKVLGGGYSESDVALWYTLETAKLLNLPTHPFTPDKPRLSLPKLLAPDPILRFHSKHSRFGIVRVVPDYMHDPESRNYGVLIATKP